MKKYVLRLTDEERKLCDETVDKLVGSSQKARRADPAASGCEQAGLD